MSDYQQWQHRRRDFRLAEYRIDPCVWNFMFSLCIEVDDGADASARLLRTLESLRQQSFHNFEILVLGAGHGGANLEPRLAAGFMHFRGLFHEPAVKVSALLNDAAADRLWRGDYLMFIPAGAIVDADAFACINRTINAAAATALPELVLCDYDRLDPDGQCSDPVFTPGWDPDFLLEQDYIGPAFLVSRSLLSRHRDRAGACGSWRDWLRSLAEPGVAFPACHVCEPLLHLPAANCPDPALPPAPIEYPLPVPPPRVAVIIPNRDRPDLLERCLGFLRFETGVPLEIIIVDHASTDARTLSLYAELQRAGAATIITTAAAFNFSRMINLGVAASSSEILLLLNNDVEISRPGTIESLLSHAVRPEIGVVSCKLLYPDGTVQHAGTLLGNGGGGGECPDDHYLVRHVMRWAPREAAGPLGILKTIRNYQAVTGALMMIRRSVFEEIGPFNETDLPVEYSDIDYCLRVRQAGYRVVCLPLDGVFHREGATRIPEISPATFEMRRQAIAYMKSHWLDRFEADPYDNPQLVLGDGSGSLLREESLPPVAPAPQPSFPDVPPAGVAGPVPGSWRQWTARSARTLLKRLPATVRKQVKTTVWRHGPFRWMANRLKYGGIAIAPPPSDFDWQVYVQRYHDLRHLATEQDAVNHYLYHGRQEGRLYKSEMPAWIYRSASPGIDPRCLQDGLCLIGHLCSEIGLGQAARNLAAALDGQRYPLSFRNLSLPGRDNEPEFRTKSMGVASRRINLVVLGLPSVETLESEITAGKRSIFYPFWELGKIPQIWLDKLRRCDEIWVPSRFGAQAFPADFPVPVRVVPLPVHRPEWPGQADAGAPDDQGILRVFTFFDFDSYASRKNPQAVIAAFQAAFAASQEDVRLTVKTRGGNDQGLRQWLAQTAAKDPRIHVIDQTLDRRQMDLLMRDCDVFVSLHRSEGFGFGAADALAAGKAVVATDYSATCDFVTQETGYPVDYDLVPVKADEYPGSDGQVWAEPRLDSAVTALRSIYANRDLARAKGRAGMRLMETMYAPEAVGRQMVALLQAIEARRPPG